MDHKKVASEILEAVGGVGNVISSTHCATRLRLEVKNQDIVNNSKIKSIRAVKGHFVTDGQNQFIIGAADVSNVYDAFVEISQGVQGHDSSKVQSSIQETKQAYRKKNKLSAGIKVISDIFVPIIPIVVAGGLLMCITAFLTTPGFVSADKSIVELIPSLVGIVGFLSHLSGIPFTFLPVLIGFSATKKFGGTPLLGATLGLCMVGGALINPAATVGVDIPVWKMFGMQVQQIGYHSTVLPILAASYILAKVEVFGRKKIKNVLNFYVPFMALVITAFITFIVIGPILRTAGFMLTDALVWLYNTAGVLGGLIMGVLYAPMVITGMHHTFIPVETQLVADVAKTGGTFILPIAAMSNVALGASSLAIAHIYRKDKELRSEAFSSGFTSILGVSEPALFGINLQYKYAFISALCGSSIGSAFFAIVKLRAVSMGAGGLLGLLCYRPGDLPVYCLGMVISISISFVLTHILAKTSLNKNDMDKIDEAESTDSNQTVVIEEKSMQNKDIIINLPLSGEVLPIEKSSDEMFAQKTMGDGIIVKPKDGKVYAPEDCQIAFVFPTGHAIGLKTKSGITLLIHCGINTVKLNGEFFKTYVETEQEVKKGTLLLEFDVEGVKKAGYSTETIVIATELDEQDKIQILANGMNEYGSEGFKIIQ